MRATVASIALAATLSLGAAAPVSAQSGATRTDRARVSINFGFQPSSVTFETSATTPSYVENAVFRTTYSVSSGPMFDAGVAVLVAGGFGLGVAVSSFSREHDAAVSGTIPHPFFFNAPRSISGTAPGLERSEVAAHIQAVYVVSSGKIDVAIAGGPSWFNLKQDLVTDVAYAETYPYDTAAFTKATTSRVTASKLGFNVGADVGVHFTRNVGAGGIVRFSRASVALAGANGVSVTVDAGGLQVGGGLRLFF
jgi:hypothetical protein